jgi:hypothetical protein
MTMRRPGGEEARRRGGEEVRWCGGVDVWRRGGEEARKSRQYLALYVVGAVSGKLEELGTRWNQVRRQLL